MLNGILMGLVLHMVILKMVILELIVRQQKYGAMVGIMIVMAVLMKIIYH